MIDEKGTKTVTINTVKLLAVVKENHDNHVKEFALAEEAYRKLVIKELREMLDNAVEGRAIRTDISFEPPQNHAKDYLRAIRMLEMTEDSTSRLDLQDFSHLVMDEWGWSSHFKTMSTNYVGAARKSG